MKSDFFRTGSISLLAGLATATAGAADRPGWVPLAHQLNLDAGNMMVYELQVRTANSCREDLGEEWQKSYCRSKVAPPIKYRMWLPSPSSSKDSKEVADWIRYWQNRGKGTFDPAQVRATFAEQSKVKLGTLDDLLEDTDDYRRAISVRYLRDKVGANAIWLMPLFPSNDSEDIPYPLDAVGSPYAVTDYMHASGMLSRACILAGRDEHALEDGKGNPCWSTRELKRVIDAAHARGMKVMLDLAFNHFGRNYRYYDYADYRPARDMIAKGYDFREPLGRPGAAPGGMWDFGGSHTFDERLLHPRILDSVASLNVLAARDPQAKRDLREVQGRCVAKRGKALAGDELVRAFGMWRDMLDWERAQFDCGRLALDASAPGHYAGRPHDGRIEPARSYDDLFYKGEWADTRFLYHHMDPGHLHEYVRNREYLFRVMNYWTSLGVDGYRLDHTIDRESGANAVSWNYIIEKTKYYAARRGQGAPVFLAEEFDYPAEISWVVDAQTEGYVGDILGRGKIKDAGFVRGVLENGWRFSPDRGMGPIYVMRGIATHDDPKPYEGSGLDVWTAAGFWGVGAASRAMAMMLSGQELGEHDGLSFKQPSVIYSRFDGRDHSGLIDFYRKMSVARQDVRNRPLISSTYDYLPPYGDSPANAGNVLARIHYDGTGNTAFTFHNLWPVGQMELSYSIPQATADRAAIRGDLSYKLVNVFDGTTYKLWHGPGWKREYTDCVSGDVLRMELRVAMPQEQRALWLRLERCE